jgi:DNA helicase-2/ATP-dependent DNA helicase PcrA
VGNVEEFVSLAQSYDRLTPPGGLAKLLEDAALMSDTDEAAFKKDLVHLMTMHAAKGLEFPVIFMVGLEEGIFPHSRSLFKPQDLEEERRLMFVGLTRAKDRIFISFALQRTHFGATQVNPPSRFIAEIPENLLEVQEDGMGEIQY